MIAAGGRVVPVQERLRLAHPYDMQQVGQLALWQQQAVARRVTQPFKQVFRELYVLTPAEIESGTVSRRFAGHALDGRIAARLLESRGWKMEYHLGMKFKPAPSLGLQAVFKSTEDYADGTYTSTSETISFVPLPWQSRWSAQRWEERLPLTDIPPLLFSEVMRDADLAVSVAQRGDEMRLTNETYQRRAELVRALVADLGLKDVTAEGHYARVRGSLAAYRVHLGSGAIHIEPGNYLCVVPDGFAKPSARVFLPFAADEDAKVSEIVSKVLLLANDHTIKDESILRQIRAA